MTLDSGPSFGSLLKRYRHAARLTQEELALRAGYTANYISMLERGVRAASPATVDVLADILTLDATERAALQQAARLQQDKASGLAMESRFGSLPSALPAEPTPLIGREREAAQAINLLRGEELQLLTLTGPGGVGKTRLALRVAATLSQDFRDGVVFVPLAPIRDPTLTLPAIAAALGLREEGGQSLQQVVIGHLQDRDFLLVLDNFEHLLQAAPLISELLAACPGLRVMVTSRAPLRLRGEQELEVPPLALPDPTHLAPLGELANYPAVALFLQRAQAIKPAFGLTDANAKMIVAICRQLDGMPLAIELAATWIRMLSPEALLRRLQRPLQLLTGGSRDLPARQQTMRNTIAWSYDLLDGGEQTLFRRLAIFVGGCMLEAAETVCDGESDERIQVLEALRSLVEGSLVITTEQEGEERRLAMLETVREYGLERLEESGEAEQLRQKHAAYYLRLGEAAAPELSGPRQVTWVSRLHDESDNLRAALAYLLDPGPGRLPWAEEALRLATALWRFWYEQGYWTEGRGWLRRALAAGGGVAAPVRARALNTAGMAALFQGDYQEGTALLAESLKLFRSLGSKHGMASSLTYLGYLAAGELDQQRVRQLLDDATALLPQLTHPSVTAYLVSFLGLGYASLGELDQGVAFLEQSAEVFRQLGDDRGRRQCLAILGLTVLSKGDRACAENLFREALELSRQSRDVLVIFFCLFGLAGAAHLGGQPERAVRLWGAADHLRQTHDLHLNLIARQSSGYDDALAWVRQQLGEVAFAAAWEEGRFLSEEGAIGYALDPQQTSRASGRPSPHPS